MAACKSKKKQLSNYYTKRHLAIEMSCSENWSEESDHDDDEQEESSGGGGSKVRCYECTFCKRGFTNAQALGAQYQQYYSILESHTNYNMYFHHPSPTAPNPRNPPPPPMPMKQPQQELLGPNLSLQIGPTTHLHRTPPIHNDAAELDLELRLGHHHPY
ncbi:transcriptional regulator TAC1-like [Senna tora]|uniref:Transcriptional regulator TAC1-like n=1 Tax=Senna tora TaxID=362788 RepID=A0A834X431_9FABA|nr:transcriptional regulator TAC1-like [Senna tora]